MSITIGSIIDDEETLANQINSRIRTRILSTTLNNSDICFESVSRPDGCSSKMGSAITYSTAITSATVNDKNSLPYSSSADFSGKITASSIIDTINNLMTYYARVQMVTVKDSSGLHGDKTPTLYFSSDPGSRTASVKSVISGDGSRPVKGNIITVNTIDTFIDKCFDIWEAYCATSPTATYTYAYCHSNHCSHGNHGSRGRR